MKKCYLIAHILHPSVTREQEPRVWMCIHSLSYIPGIERYSGIEINLCFHIHQVWLLLWYDSRFHFRIKKKCPLWRSSTMTLPTELFTPVGVLPQRACITRSVFLNGRNRQNFEYNMAGCVWKGMSCSYGSYFIPLLHSIKLPFCIFCSSCLASNHPSSFHSEAPYVLFSPNIPLLQS